MYAEFLSLRQLKLAELGGGRGTATTVDKHALTPAYTASHSLSACDFTDC